MFKKKKKSQFELVAEHLCKKGKISSWEAITRYGITRLSQYILQMRKAGIIINSNWVREKGKNPYVMYELVDQAIDMELLLNKKRLDTTHIEPINLQK